MKANISKSNTNRSQGQNSIKKIICNSRTKPAISNPSSHYSTNHDINKTSFCSGLKHINTESAHEVASHDSSESRQYMEIPPQDINKNENSQLTSVISDKHEIFTPDIIVSNSSFRHGRSRTSHKLSSSNFRPCDSVNKKQHHGIITGDELITVSLADSNISNKTNIRNGSNISNRQLQIRPASCGGSKISNKKIINQGSIISGKKSICISPTISLKTSKCNLQYLSTIVYKKSIDDNPAETTLKTDSILHGESSISGNNPGIVSPADSNTTIWGGLHHGSIISLAPGLDNTYQNNLEHGSNFFGNKLREASPTGSNTTNLSNIQHFATNSCKPRAPSPCHSYVINRSNPHEDSSIPANELRATSSSNLTNLSNIPHESTTFDNASKYRAPSPSVSNVTNWSNPQKQSNLSVNKPRESCPTASDTSNLTPLQQGLIISDNKSKYLISDNTHDIDKLHDMSTSNKLLSSQSPDESKKLQLPLCNFSHNYTVSNNPSCTTNVLSTTDCNTSKTKWTCPNNSDSTTVETAPCIIKQTKVHLIKIKRKILNAFRRIKKKQKTSNYTCNSKQNVAKTKWSCPNFGPCNEPPVKLKNTNRMGKLLEFCKNNKYLQHIPVSKQSPTNNKQYSDSYETKTKWSCPNLGPCNETPRPESKRTTLKKVIIDYLKKTKRSIVVKIDEGLRKVKQTKNHGISPNPTLTIHEESKASKTKWQCPEISVSNETPKAVPKTTKIQKLLERLKKFRKFTVRKIKIYYRSSKVMNTISYDLYNKHISILRQKFSKFRETIRQIQLNKQKLSAPKTKRKFKNIILKRSAENTKKIKAEIPEKRSKDVAETFQPSAASSPPVTKVPVIITDVPPPTAEIPPPNIPQSADTIVPSNDINKPVDTFPPNYKKTQIQKQRQKPPKAKTEKPKKVKVAKVKQEKKSTLYEVERSEQFLRDRDWFKEEYLRHIGVPQKEFRSESGLERNALSELKDQRIQCITERLFYRKQVLHGANVTNVDFRNTPLASRCICPERNCTCYLKRSALSYRKFFMPYAIPFHYIWKAILHVAPCMHVNGRNSLVPKLANKCSQESALYNSPKGIKMLKLSGPQFCLYGCKGYFMAGRTFLIRRGGGSAKVVYAKKKKGLPSMPVDTNVTICDYYHCTVSTQTTFTPKGELVYGEIVRTIYGAIGEGIFRDLSGTKLELSAYKHEPRVPCAVNMDNILHYNVIKQRLSNWKCGLYSSIRKSGTCLKEGFTETPCDPDNSARTISLKTLDDPSARCLKPCRSLGKSKLKKSSVSFGDVIDKDLELTEVIGIGKNRAIRIKEIIGDGIDNSNISKTMSNETNNGIKSDEDTEQTNIVQEKDPYKTDDLKTEVRDNAQRLTPLARLSKITDEIMKWMFPTEPLNEQEPQGFEYSVSSCQDGSKQTGEKLAPCVDISKPEGTPLSDDMQNDVLVIDNQNNRPQATVEDKKDDVTNSTTEAQGIEPIRNDVTSVIPLQPLDLGAKEMLTTEEYVERTLCKPRSDGTCGPMIKENPLTKIICPHCRSYKLDTSLYKTVRTPRNLSSKASAHNKDLIVFIPDSKLTTAPNVEIKRENIIKTDIQESVASKIPSDVKMESGETNLECKQTPIVEDKELENSPNKSDLQAPSVPQSEAIVTNEEYIEQTLCKPRSDGTCRPLVKEKPSTQIICPHCRSYKLDTNLYNTASTAKDNTTDIKENLEVLNPLITAQNELDLQSNMKEKNQETRQEEVRGDLPLRRESFDLDKTKNSNEQCCKFNEQGALPATESNLDNDDDIPKPIDVKDDTKCSNEITKSQQNNVPNKVITNAICGQGPEVDLNIIKVSSKDVTSSEIDRKLCNTNSTTNKINRESKQEFCRFYNSKGLTLLTFNDPNMANPEGSQVYINATKPQSKDKESELIINKLWHVDNNESTERNNSKHSKTSTFSEMLKKLRGGTKIDVKTSVQSKNSNKPSEVMIEKTSYEKYDEIIDKESKTHDIVTMTNMSVDQIVVNRSRENDNKTIGQMEENTDQNVNKEPSVETKTVTEKISEPKYSRKSEMSGYRYYY